MKQSEFDFKYTDLGVGRKIFIWLIALYTLDVTVSFGIPLFSNSVDRFGDNILISIGLLSFVGFVFILMTHKTVMSIIERRVGSLIFFGILFSIFTNGAGFIFFAIAYFSYRERKQIIKSYDNNSNCLAV